MEKDLLIELLEEGEVVIKIDLEDENQ